MMFTVMWRGVGGGGGGGGGGGRQVWRKYKLSSLSRRKYKLSSLSELSIRVSPSHFYNAGRAGLGWMNG
jgi:hypothetical protein